MSEMIFMSKTLQKALFICSVLSTGASETSLLQARAQTAWNNADSPKDPTNKLIWEKTVESEKSVSPPMTWNKVPEPERDSHQPSTSLIWEILDANDSRVITRPEAALNRKFNPPTTAKEFEALRNTIPLQSSNFKAITNLSHAVPTASVLRQEEWRLTSTTISPFHYASGTGNQNYAIQIDYGFSDKLQISGFYSEADDPLNASINGLDIRPANFWQVFGGAARWQFLEKKNWTMALNSSVERWTVGSGGSDSRGRKSENDASPNIFNKSGKRVETENLIGSISLPLTWHLNNKWQFTLNPGVSFLPSSQGRGQGGAGDFYGTNSYISGGLLWRPIPDLGLTASITQPLGDGTNSFDRNLKYSRVPVFSAGLNWHLNPRIALQGQLTNGFGATPATALLTLPSDNRLGYSAKLVLTPDAADTPQPRLSSKQRSLSLGGLTVNTALVPPNTISTAAISADAEGNLDTLVGYSISNIFQFNFYRSSSTNVPQDNPQARSYLNDGATNWRGSGKAVLTSPLRGAPLWSALRLSFGRNINTSNNTTPGYLFAETPFTWEANSRIPININPKIAWSGSGSLWGLGISTNIDLAPRWEIIPETNIVLNSQKDSNFTLGLRWNVSENTAIEVYGSTASSMVDMGQLLNAEQIRWGSRLTFKL